MANESIGDLLEGAATSNEKSTKKAKKVKKENPAKKPSKAIITKPGPTPKAGKKAKPAKEEAPTKKAKTVEKAKPTKNVEQPDMHQPDDSVVIKAVRRLKEPAMASKFAADLGVHRRVIRMQLQRLAKEKANGVGMKKEGPHWIVSNKQ